MIGETSSTSRCPSGPASTGQQRCCAHDCAAAECLVRRLEQRYEIGVIDAQQQVGSDERVGYGVLLADRLAAARRRCSPRTPANAQVRFRRRWPPAGLRRGAHDGGAPGGPPAAPRSRRRRTPGASRSSTSVPPGSRPAEPVARRISPATENGPRATSCSIASSQLSQRSAPMVSSSTGLNPPPSSAFSAVRV